MSDCTILILTYKGIKHLKFLLPTIKETIENSHSFSYDVLIVDNGCDEETRTFVINEFPEFTIQDAKENDYLFSLNSIVKNLNTAYVFILNDDMKLHPEVLNKIMPVIKNDSQLFSVGCNVLDWEGKESTVGVRVMEYSRGWMHSYFVELKDKEIRYTLYGGGGAAVFNTDYFNRLNGFNPLMRPAYGEDLDLGHRAWHRGWYSVIHPAAYLYHREGGTIHAQFKSDELEQKTSKNVILWMLRNVNMKGFLFYFFILLPVRFIRWRKLHYNLYIALKMAIPKFGTAIRQRISSKRSKMNDQEIIQTLNKIYGTK